MAQRIIVALQTPGSKRADSHFSLRIKDLLSNEPSTYSMPPRILAVSDIEGNFYNFRRLLIKQGVIDKNYQWSFGDGHLVIVGDCLDRGERVIECLWLIYSLEERARRAGGYVHFILGNHEIMNLNGGWRYTHPRYSQHNRTPGRSYAALYDGNNELWRWLYTKNIIEKIGNILFVHGGISEHLNISDLSLEDINRIARGNYNNVGQLFDDSLLTLLFNSNSSPFWYRGYYKSEATIHQVDDTLRTFDADTIVTGHTPMEKVTSFFDGKVINIDTGHVSGKSESLLIENNAFYRVSIDGMKERLK